MTKVICDEYFRDRWHNLPLKFTIKLVCLLFAVGTCQCGQRAKAVTCHTIYKYAHWWQKDHKLILCDSDINAKKKIVSRMCTIYTHNTYHVCVCICRSSARVYSEAEQGKFLPLCKPFVEVETNYIDRQIQRERERDGERR